MINLKLSFSEKMAILASFVLLLAFIVGKVTSPFRCSPYQYVYHYGFFVCLFLHFSALIISVGNSILIIRVLTFKPKKVFWLVLSLIPTLFWVVTYFQIILSFRIH